MDVISILKEDHREVEALFGRIEAASARAVKSKRQLFNQINSALTAHAAAEEEILYPRMRELRPLRQQSFEASEEHRLVKQLLTELSELEVGNEIWNAKVKVLLDMVRHHVEEEEQQYFKTLRSQLERTELRQLGEQIQSFKERFIGARKTAPVPRAEGTYSQPQA